MLLMAVAVILMSIVQALVRHASKEIHPFEIVFFRNLIAFAILSPIAFRASSQAWRTNMHGTLAVRGVLGVAAMLLWFYGLSLVPIADATALNFMGVIFITLCAAAILKERVDIHRWIAVAAGFCGTLVILRPGIVQVNEGVLVVLVATLLWSVSTVLVKVLSRSESSVTIVFYSGLYFTPLSLVAALFVWQWPTGGQLLLLAAIGVVSTLSHLAAAQAFREADATVVMPIDFTRLIWTALLGYLLFGEFPDLWTWIGAVIIFSSAVYISVRERRAGG